MNKTNASVFEPEAFLASTGTARKTLEYEGRIKIFGQGDACKHVMYIQKGCVKLSVVNEVGKGSCCCNAGARGLFRRRMSGRAEGLHRDSHLNGAHGRTLHRER
jgi:hypothetical protein